MSDGIEKVARAISGFHTRSGWESSHNEWQECCRNEARVAIGAIIDTDLRTLLKQFEICKKEYALPNSDVDIGEIYNFAWKFAEHLTALTTPNNATDGGI